MKHRLSVVFWVACAVVYVLPWAGLGQGAVQFNGHDFAEWLSLLPAERQASPALLAVFSVRMYLVFALCLVASFLQGRVCVGLAILLSVSLLPPLEFLQNLQDSNYQQQALVAALALILPLSVTRLPIASRRYALAACITLMGLGGAFLLWRVSVLAETYQITLTPNLGAFGVALSVFWGIVFWGLTQRQDDARATLS